MNFVKTENNEHVIPTYTHITDTITFEPATLRDFLNNYPLFMRNHRCSFRMKPEGSDE